ncbi:MAG: phosphate ABC transporter permease subunit PstC [Saprospiraceae bacterium]|nr:phosphate ABC transporter permease subunit PstC [Saprospiraceae bacterium]
MKRREKIVVILLWLCTSITVLTTTLIIWILVSQSFTFFQHISIKEFLTDLQWTPLFSIKKYGILPLLSGTLLCTVIAIAVAFPLGVSIAIYLSEYAPEKLRNILKPLLEILAAIPTVVYGFFALTVVTPFLKDIFPEINTFNALSAGLVMGIMIIPMISSLCEDAIRAVPTSLREASYSLGSTVFQTSFKVLLPAASSGIIVSTILAISRAIGETMIVTIAAGQQPNLTLNPLHTVETITSYIVQVSMGDIPQGSIEFQTIFAAGLTLFVFTFILNNISHFFRRKYQQKYD